MTREEFLNLWNVSGLVVFPNERAIYASASVKAHTRFKGHGLLLNFDLYTEEEVFDMGFDFFKQLKEKLPELDKFALQKIADENLKYNDTDISLSELRMRKPLEGKTDGFYSQFALTYYNGTAGQYAMMMLHVCFDKDFNFTKCFVERVSV